MWAFTHVMENLSNKKSRISINTLIKNDFYVIIIIVIDNSKQTDLPIRPPTPPKKIKIFFLPANL